MLRLNSMNKNELLDANIVKIKDKKIKNNKENNIDDNNKTTENNNKKNTKVNLFSSSKTIKQQKEKKDIKNEGDESKRNQQNENKNNSMHPNLLSILSKTLNVMEKDNIDFIEEFTLPKLEDPRTIIVMSKKGHTNDLYPREYGKIKKDYERMKGNK